MSLTSLLSDLPNPKRGPRCSVGLLLERLAGEDPKGFEALVARLDDHGVSARALSEALHKAGHAVKAETIRRHRKRGTGSGCSCR